MTTSGGETTAHHPMMNRLRFVFESATERSTAQRCVNSGRALFLAAVGCVSAVAMAIKHEATSGSDCQLPSGQRYVARCCIAPAAIIAPAFNATNRGVIGRGVSRGRGVGSS